MGVRVRAACRAGPPLNRGKDVWQGFAMLDAEAEAMPQCPLDTAFEAEVPDELTPHHARRKAERGERKRRARAW